MEQSEISLLKGFFVILIFRFLAARLCFRFVSRCWRLREKREMAANSVTGMSRSREGPRPTLSSLNEELIRRE